MRKAMMRRLCVLTIFATISVPIAAQTVTQPPSGANQKAAVIQRIGLVEVRIDYSSPDVTGPAGQDRSGEIWGQLVPYGLTDLGFGNGNPGPWRAGANENTVFSVSHDVLVQGQPLAAGTYGLHMIAGEEEWTIVFSTNHSSWGSFFYDPAEDALRVDTKSEEAPYREWLNYDFVDRQADQATVALHWENLRVPFTISVPNIVDLYVDTMRDELRSAAGFTWQSWNAAVVYCLQNNTNLDEALEWAEVSITTPFVGQANFTTLSTKAQVLAALGRDAEAKETMTVAVNNPGTTAQQIHGAARQLQLQGSLDDALEMFKLNAKRFGDETWPVTVGMARVYSAEGNYKKALHYARMARSQAPDPLNQGNLDTAIEILESDKDFNLTN